MSEFKLIERIRQRVSSHTPGVALGIGDDAAVLDVEEGFQLVASTDWLIEGVHFSAGDPPLSTGHKALAVNLSDLAAMGAIPRWILLNIAAPENDLDWIEETTIGVLALAAAEGVVLVGGDTSVGQRATAITALGQVEQGCALLRSGAMPGDLVVISGVTGEAAYAFEALRSGREPSNSALNRLRQPRPRIALGRALVGKASACIDISDGLLADLSHIAERSSCGAVIELNKLPSSPSLDRLEHEQRWELQMTGGDDYELCFTLPPEHLPHLGRWSEELELELTVIGSMTDVRGVRLLDGAGKPWTPTKPGWEHFQ